jgi:hypothetical protein
MRTGDRCEMAGLEITVGRVPSMLRTNGPAASLARLAAVALRRGMTPARLRHPGSAAHLGLAFAPAVRGLPCAGIRVAWLCRAGARRDRCCEFAGPGSRLHRIDRYSAVPGPGGHAPARWSPRAGLAHRAAEGEVAALDSPGGLVVVAWRPGRVQHDELEFLKGRWSPDQPRGELLDRLQVTVPVAVAVSRQWLAGAYPPWRLWSLALCGG